MELTKEIMDVVEDFELNEDAKQDAYVKILEADEFPEFATKGHRDNYIRQLVFWTRKNEESKLLNRSRIIEENEEEIRALYTQHEEYSEDPAELVGNEQHMEKFLSELSDTNRRTFEKLYLEGYTPEDLAVEEGIARNAIDQRVHYIKKQLRGEV